MSQQPSIKKNYIYRLLYEILVIITPFITAPYVSRVLGADGIGTQSYVQSYMTFFTMFAALGTASYGMREIARCRVNKKEYSKKFWEIELLTVITTLTSLFVWLLLIFFSKEYRFYYVALIPTLFATLFDISWFYTAHEKVGYTVFWNALCKIAGVVCIFLFINGKDDLFLYILLNTTFLMLGNISMWVFLPKMLVKVDVKELRFKNHFKETLIYFIPTIATSVYTVLDKTLIGIITQNVFENGYYEQATKIINVAKTGVFVAVNSVMEARIVFLFAENKINEIKQRINKSIDFILLLGYGAMFGIMGVAKTFVPVFFGDGYDQVVILLYWMAPLIVIIGISNCIGSQYYIPAGLRGKSAKFIIIGALVNLLVNLIMIPLFGATGAVIGTLVAEIVITFLYFRNCDGYVGITQIKYLSIKKIFAGVVMFFILIICGNCLEGIKGLLLQVSIGSIVYFVVLLILNDKIVKEFIITLSNKFKRRE